jgi:HD superfamily phosphohydrolase
MYLTGRLLDRISRKESLSKDSITESKAAALLHDIGHLPFSHVPEPLLELRPDIKHESQEKNVKPSELLTMKIIQSAWMKEIFEELNKKSGRFSLNVDNVAKLAIGSSTDGSPNNKFLGEVNHGNFDADRMDYLMRDAHYTGVPLGTLDVERLIRTATTSTSLGGIKHLVTDIKGLHSLESMIVARSVMYSAVYFHHGVRAADSMILRAVYSIFKKDPIQLLNFDDHTLMGHLNRDAEARPLIDRLRSRNLFKPSLAIRTTDALDKSALMKFVSEASVSSAVEHEESINKKMSKDGRKHCILDLPKIEIYSEISADIRETLGDRERVLPVRDHSRIAKGVEDDSEVKWRGYVFGPREELAGVRKAALEHLEAEGLRFTFA